MAELTDAFFADALEPADALDDVAVGLELGGLTDAAGWKVVCPTAKPIFDAYTPPIVIASVVFLLVITKLPLRFRVAVTLALPKKSLLSAYIKSPTLSFPVDAYVVVSPPAVTVTVPPSSIPRVVSGVRVVTGVVPMPTAGVALEADLSDGLEAPVELELEDDEDAVDVPDTAMTGAQ